MCGFLGLIGQNLQPRHLAQGYTSLRRRGPDSQQTWIDSSERVGLMHARLAIVDPIARANQPLANGRGDLIVAFNGEIYNHHEIRKTLRGYAFQTDADTEVILAAYECEQFNGLARLKGMFSFALVDLTRRCVIVMRDAVGKKPLFIARGMKSLAFGSSIEALRAVMHANNGERPALRADALDGYWMHGHMPANESAFLGVTLVLPGQALVFDFQGNLLESKVITPALQHQYQGESAETCTKRLRALLEAAVTLRADPAGELSVLLSGGVDSTIVSAITNRLAQQRGQKINALTLASFIPNTNDERYARFAAKREGLDLKLLYLPRDNLAERVCSKLDLQDEPLGFISYFLLSQLVEAAAEHGRILLTGDGGDEVFMGYGKPSDWMNASINTTAALPCGPPLPSWLSAWGVEMASSALLGHGFCKTDRASAEQGVELRSPLLDWDVMSYARSLPYARLFPKDTAKSLLKTILADWPSKFVERKKLGFTFNMRWYWGFRGFAGLRESFAGLLVAGLAEKLPAELSPDPRQWSNLQCFRHFSEIWKALAWQRFVHRSQ